MSHRTKIVNGVKHGRRCCCPACDPNDTILAKIRSDNREAARAARAAKPANENGGGALSASIAAARWSASHRPRRPPRGAPEPETKRLRQLLREGIPIARALEIVEAEKKGTP